MRILRFLLFFVLTLISCKEDKLYPAFQERTMELRDQALAPFYHGVASGDPLYEQVIIWTRVTPPTSLPFIDGSWEVAADSTFTTIIKEGAFKTTPARDYTVKVDVDGLSEGTIYFYRFRAMDAMSPVGRTRTASKNPQSLKFGIVSCSNYEWGYFNAYKHLSEEKDLQAVLHLGDYIYEYGPGTYGDTTIGRIHIPDYEILSLTDYRDRYAQYRLDKDLQKVHAMHPFINIWDDHEIANNSYVDGAQNHQEEEGSYEERKENAKRAFYEWLPIRESQQHYRDFGFGSLADVIMLDERLEGRTAPADSVTDPVMDQKDHRLLGETQFNWLADKLAQSGATWKIIGNQVIYSYLDWGYDGFQINLDSWDGYPAEQMKLANLIKNKAVKNVVFVTGDTHTSWAFEATNNPFEQYDPSTGEGAFAVEFGVTSINSSNRDEREPADSVKLHEKKIVNSPINPHLRYTNMRDHGYVILTLTPETATAEYKMVDTVKKPESSISVDTSIVAKKGSSRLYPANQL